MFGRGTIMLGIGPHSSFLYFLQAHNPNGISIGSAAFAQMTVECAYTLQWDTPFPLKIAPSHGGDLDPHLIHDSLSPPIPHPKRHLDRFSRFCRAD